MECEKKLKSQTYNRLEPIGSLFFKIGAELAGDSVPFAKVSNKLICIASLTEWGVKKLSLKQGAKVIWIRPETKGFSDEQAEGIKYWRAEPVFVAPNWDDLSLGVKSYFDFGDSWFSAKTIKVVCF